MKDTRRFVFCVLLSASAGSFFPHRTVAQDQPDQDQICEIRKVGDCGLRRPRLSTTPIRSIPTERARRKSAELSLRTFWTLLRELSSRRRTAPHRS